MPVHFTAFPMAQLGLNTTHFQELLQKKKSFKFQLVVTLLCWVLEICSYLLANGSKNDFKGVLPVLPLKLHLLFILGTSVPVVCGVARFANGK